ncbi:MAG: ATP-binding protein [Paracoccaceae bacterium]
MREISSTHQALIRDALPVLTQTRVVEQELGEIFLALQNAGHLGDTEHLISAKLDLSRRIDRFKDNVLNVTQASGGSGLSVRMARLLTELEASIDQLFTQQAILFETDLKIARLEETINETGSQASDALRTLRYDLTIRIDTLLDDARLGATPEAKSIDQLFSDLFLGALNLNSLAIDLDAVIDTSLFDQISGGQNSIEQMRTNLEDKLGRVAALLPQLRPSAQRTELADLTLQLNAYILGEKGLLALGVTRLTHQEKMLILQQTRSNMTRDVSVFIETIVNTAQTSVTERAAALDEATRQLSIILMVCLFLAATCTLIGNSIIVEKQVNRRMGRLDEAVRAIAGGDLDHPIDVDGQDELGDIARALHVFKENAEELGRSNVDLERFAYVAAHDLRSPLRAVHDLVEWTIEDEENVLSHESREYLDMMQNRTKRLDRLLTDLLDYACAGQDEQDLATLTLSKLIDQVTNLLNPPADFSIRMVGDDLTVKTYPTPLTQVLINLIGNAIKHHDQHAGNVTISASFVADRLVVNVTDDGPGIPLAYQERVFELFQTLRPRDEVEGSGLGLAIIRKIIDRYRSTLTLKSDPEITRGTCFNFDFPAELIAVTSPLPATKAA